MNKLYIFITVMFIIIFSSAYYKCQEPFVPKIVKEHYRPLERNIRTRANDFYTKTNTVITNVLRKINVL